MAELRSPLAGAVVAGRHGQVGPNGPPLVLSEGNLGCLWQVAGWRDFADAAEPVLAALGWSGLGDHRTVRVSAGAECYRVAPDRLWLRGTEPTVIEAALALGPTGRLAKLDLSHSRCVIRLSGTKSEDLLARVSSLDFALRTFPIDGFAQTGIHQVAVLIRRLSQECFDIFVPVTWAVSLWDWLCTNAEPFGYVVEPGRA